MRYVMVIGFDLRQLHLSRTAWHFRAYEAGLERRVAYCFKMARKNYKLVLEIRPDDRHLAT
jgi:hypothetical protein